MNLSYTMPKLLPPGAEELIKLLTIDKLGPKAIKKKLEQLNMEVSLRSINNVNQCNGQKRSYAAIGLTVPKITNKRKVWTKGLIEKVAKEVNKKNPKT